MVALQKSRQDAAAPTDLLNWATDWGGSDADADDSQKALWMRFMWSWGPVLGSLLGREPRCSGFRRPEVDGGSVSKSYAVQRPEHQKCRSALLLLGLKIEDSRHPQRGLQRGADVC